MKLKTTYALFDDINIYEISKEEFEEYKKYASQLMKEGKLLYTIKYINKKHLKETFIEIFNEICFRRAAKQLYETMLKNGEIKESD